jgi:hypothetical protein
VRERRDAPAAERRQHRDEDRDRDEARQELPRITPALAQHLGHDDVEEDQHRRHAVDAGDLGDLHEIVRAMLGVAERGPREADEEPAAQPLERHPERRREPDDVAPASLEEPDARRERAVIAAERARHDEHDAHRDGPRHGRVVHDRVADPVRRREVERDAREPAEEEPAAGRAALDRTEQRHESDPGERSEVERRERRREEEPAQHGHGRAPAEAGMHGLGHGDADLAVRADEHGLGNRHASIARRTARSFRCMRRASAGERSWS